MATGESRIYQFDIPMEVVREEAVPLANSPREIDPTTDTRLGKNADGNAVQNDKTIKTFKTARPDAVAKLAPADPWTRRMLAYRDTLADREYGHFVLGGEPMREGDRGKRVARVREALRALGFHVAYSVDPEFFGRDMRSAVFRFQEAYGLSADGVIGEGTLGALSEPKEFLLSKIDQAISQPARPVADKMVIVNIAAQRLRYIVNGEERFSARVVVGRPDRQTPELTAKITGITFNPSWYIPPGIEAMDVLPQMARDPGYAERAELKIYDVERGWVPIDPAEVDWSEQPTRYTFVQQAGPDNALGRIKLDMWNEHFVFLHDTPNRRQFDWRTRSLSSGCVRVENIATLARELLGEGAWLEHDVAARLAAGETFRVELQEPVTVVLEYRLADIESDGEIRFHRDIYDRLRDDRGPALLAKRKADALHAMAMPRNGAASGE
jgi:murein L,D-transpeptidase YcbB/YkuD